MPQWLWVCVCVFVCVYVEMIFQQIVVFLRVTYLLCSSYNFVHYFWLGIMLGMKNRGDKRNRFFTIFTIFAIFTVLWVFYFLWGQGVRGFFRGKSSSFELDFPYTFWAIFQNLFFGGECTKIFSFFFGGGVKVRIIFWKFLGMGCEDKCQKISQILSVPCSHKKMEDPTPIKHL